MESKSQLRQYYLKRLISVGRSSNIIIVLLFFSMSGLAMVFVKVDNSTKYFNQKIDMPLNCIKPFYGEDNDAYGQYLVMKGLAIEAKKHGIETQDTTLDDFTSEEQEKIKNIINNNDLKQFIIDLKSSKLLLKISQPGIQLPHTQVSSIKTIVHGKSFQMKISAYTPSIIEDTQAFKNFIAYHVKRSHPLFCTSEIRSGYVIESRIKLEFDGSIENFNQLKQMQGVKIYEYTNISDNNNLLFMNQSYIFDEDKHYYILVTDIIPKHAGPTDKAEEVYKSSIANMRAYVDAQRMVSLFNNKSINIFSNTLPYTNSSLSVDENMQYGLMEVGQSFVYIDSNNIPCIFLITSINTQPSMPISQFESMMFTSTPYTWMNYWISIAQ